MPINLIAGSSPIFRFLGGGILRPSILYTRLSCAVSLGVGCFGVGLSVVLGQESEHIFFML